MLDNFLNSLFWGLNKKVFLFLLLAGCQIVQSRPLPPQPLILSNAVSVAKF